MGSCRFRLSISVYVSIAEIAMTYGGDLFAPGEFL